MPIISLDNFFTILINSATEVAQTLAVGDKPQIKFAGSRKINGGELIKLMQSGHIFKADFGGESDGRFIMIIPESLALVLSGSLLGSGEPDNFGSAEKSAVFELLNNMAGRIAGNWGDTVEETFTVTSQEIIDSPIDNITADESWIEIKADIEIGDEKSEITSYFTAKFVDAAEKKLGLSAKAPEDNMDEETTKEESVEKTPSGDTPSEETQDTPADAEVSKGKTDAEVTPESAEPEQSAEPPVTEPQVAEPQVTESPGANIRQAQFAQISEDKTAGTDEENRSINLIMDVPLLISVELGRKDLTIKEILELSPGSLIELNQLAGEPVDLLINGKLFARGEVVVIDENFGIRVTAIISPQERVEKIR